MVKIIAISLGAIAAIMPFAAAINFQDGLNYCGYNLLNIGNYGDQVNQALVDANQATDNSHTHESLFQCNGGENGDITFKTFCSNGCRNGGSGAADACA